MAIFQNNMYWAAKSFENINTIVTEALNMNSSYLIFSTAQRYLHSSTSCYIGINL